MIGMASRRMLCRFAVVAALALPSPELAAQTMLPPHAVSVSDRSGCEVDLLPNATYGPAPRLRVSSRGVSGDRIGLYLTSDSSLTDPEIVFRNGRAKFEPVAMSPWATITSSALWKTLVAAAEEGEPVHFTARTPGGDWASARYEGLDPMHIFRILEINECFSSATLTTQTPEELRAAEQALGLRPEEITHIRWVLYQINKRRDAPSASLLLHFQDRSYLERYAATNGFGPARYLDRALVAHLLGEPIRPVRPDLSDIGRDRQRYRYWISVRHPSAYCEITTLATRIVGPQPYHLPRIRLAARPGESGAGMYIDLVSPMPFSETGAVWAVVDGRRYELQVQDGRVMPVSTGENNVSNNVTRAFRAGRNIQISGIDIRSGAVMRIDFSAYGFTDAFNSMMGRCNRWGMRNWLE